LHVVAGNLYGGIETILVALAHHRHLCPEMEPHYALCFEGRVAEELRAASAAVHLLNPVRFSKPWTVFSARRRMKELLSRENIDVAVCHSAWPHALFAPVVKRVGMGLVHWMHSRTDGRHWTEMLARRHTPDFVITVSRDAGAHLKNIFPAAEQQVIYTPIPNTGSKPLPEQSARLRADLDTPAGSIVIAQASRMEDWKGHRVHLEALARLKKDPRWICWMIGGAQRSAEQEYLNSLKTLSVKLGIDEHVRFLGQRSDVQNLLHAADIYCQPNTGPEGFSLVFMEACLARLPIVTSSLGGALEIVDDSNGALTPPGDAAAVSEALQGLIADHSKRKRMGDASFERVMQMCDPETQLKKLCAVFIKVHSRVAQRY
jgi:glycosyltransferase involved in cell wall biosynthesis